MTFNQLKNIFDTHYTWDRLEYGFNIWKGKCFENEIDLYPNPVQSGTRYALFNLRNGYIMDVVNNTIELKIL